MFYIFDEAPVLDIDGEIFYDKFDPMLDEFSLFGNVKHDSQEYDKKWVIVNYSQEANEKFPKYCFPQFKTFLDLKEDVEKPFEDEECYDEVGLFRIECWVVKFLHTIILSFSIEEITRRQWSKDAPLRHNLLLQKGSYFSQPDNGFV